MFMERKNPYFSAKVAKFMYFCVFEIKSELR